MMIFEGETFNSKNLPDSFENIEFIECIFQSLDIQDTSFKNSRFVECHFNKSNISNSVVTNAAFRICKFESCKLIGINFSSTQSFFDIELIDCHSDFTIFNSLKIPSFKASNTLFKESDFSETNIEKAIFDNCNLEGANFSKANLNSADLSTAYNYNIDPAFTKIKKTKFSLPEAVSLLKAFDIELV